MKEFQSSLTFAHEVSHNLGAIHDEDKDGNAISGTLMGATLGNNVTISNLKISKETKKDIRDVFTNVTKGIRYELFKTLDKTFIKEWSQDDIVRVRQGYQEINCFKAKLNYSNDNKHFLKLKKDLENQVNPIVPRKLKQNITESTTALTSVDSGSINFNVSNVKFLFLFSERFLIFCCTCILHF